MSGLAIAMIVAASATAAADCRPGDEPRTVPATVCEDSSGRSDDRTEAADENRDRAVPDARRRTVTSEADDDPTRDDDERACITRAANGVCLDEDED